MREAQEPATYVLIQIRTCRIASCRFEGMNNIIASRVEDTNLDFVRSCRHSKKVCYPPQSVRWLTIDVQPCEKCVYMSNHNDAFIHFSDSSTIPVLLVFLKTMENGEHTKEW